LLLIAFLLFAGAAVASIFAMARIVISARESGADIGAGIIGVMAVILFVAGCVAAALANRIRHS
jgi:hypothetical protein